mgnify:CR=1 FL=1
MERPVINKERLGGYYRLSAYVLAKYISELPIILIFPFVMFTIAFWVTGLNTSFLAYLQILGLIFLCTALAQVRSIQHYLLQVFCLFPATV